MLFLDPNKVPAYVPPAFISRSKAIKKFQLKDYVIKILLIKLYPTTSFMLRTWIQSNMLLFMVWDRARKECSITLGISGTNQNIDIPILIETYSVLVAQNLSINLIDEAMLSEATVVRWGWVGVNFKQ